MIEQPQWIDYLKVWLPVPIGVSLVLLAFYFAFLHLEQIDILLGRLFALFALLSRRFRKRATAKDLEARINKRAETIESEVQDLMPHPMRIEWIESGEEFAVQRDGDIVVLLRDRLDDSRNKIAAIQSYLGRGFLSDSRSYIARDLMRSIDLVMTWKLLGTYPESDDAHAYFDTLYNPLVESKPSFASNVDRIMRLDDSGVFTRILLREFRSLGRRFQRILPRQHQHQETEAFTDFLDEIEQADRGTHVPLNFMGKSIRASIQLVASIDTLAQSGLRTHRYWLKKNVQRGAETIYISGIGERNVKLARNLAQWGHKEFITETVRSQVYGVTTPQGNVRDAILITCHSRHVNSDSVLDPEEEVHAALVRHIPEIAYGEVEVLDIAREVGLQSKVILQGARPGRGITDYDFVKLNRNIHGVVADLQESVWLIPWNDDPGALLISVLGIRAGDVAEISVDAQARQAEISVSDEIVIAKAVGTKGSNVRLCRRMTGYQVHISTELNSQARKSKTNQLVSPEDALRMVLVEVIPDIRSGLVEVIDVIREPGIQSKIIVRSTDGRNPIYRCLGPDKSYLDEITGRLKEQVWFVPWSAEPEELLLRCLGVRHRSLVSVEIETGIGMGYVRVTDNNAAAMAIGENGVNVKQAARLMDLRRVNIQSLEHNNQDDD